MQSGAGVDQGVWRACSMQHGAHGVRGGIACESRCVACA